MHGKTKAALLLAALTLAPWGARAADTYDINVILPMTGGASFVGKGQHDSLEALAAVVNKAGGIGGKPLKWIYHDDQTSPQIAVQLANEILADKPSVMLGSSIVAMCAAIAPLMKNGPVDYCLSPGYHPHPGDFVFSAASSSTDQFAAVVRYYRMMGWTKIALLSTTDASGQDGDHAIDQVLARPENKDVKKVIQEHFNPTDLSVAAQIENIKASGAHGAHRLDDGRAGRHRLQRRDPGRARHSAGANERQPDVRADGAMGGFSAEEDADAVSALSRA